MLCTSGFVDDVMFSHKCQWVKTDEAILRHTHNLVLIGGLPSFARWQHRIVARGGEVCYPRDCLVDIAIDQWRLQRVSVQKVNLNKACN